MSIAAAVLRSFDAMDANGDDTLTEAEYMAVRMGRLADSSLGARYLGVNPWVLVASADYLQRRGTPDTPEALRSQDAKTAIPPLYGTLLKNEQDVHLFERVAFLARRGQ